LSTEVTYSKSLNLVVKQFLTPLRDKPHFYSIQAADVNAIFSNIEFLATFHQQFLQELTQATASPQADREVGAVFLKLSDFLKMYSQYMNGYAAAMETINGQFANQRFQNFLGAKRKECGLDLMSYLIMPVQRIPRYEMLLGELGRHAQDGQGKQALQDAYNKVKSIAIHINETKRAVESMTKLLEVQNRISGDFTLLSPSRRLVKEGPLIKMNSQSVLGSKSHIRVFFLFTDILLWTSPAYAYRGHIQLTGAEIEKEAALETEKKHKKGWSLRKADTHREEESLSIVIKASRQMVVVAADAREKQLWQAALTSTLQQFNSGERAREEREERANKANSSSSSSSISSISSSSSELAPPLQEREAGPTSSGTNAATPDTDKAAAVAPAPSP